MASLRIRTSRLQKGMIIKNNVYSNTGNILVAANTRVTNDVLKLLANFFIDYVMVEYEAINFETETVNNMVQEKAAKITEEQAKLFQKNIKIAENNLSQNMKAIVLQNKDINVDEMLNDLNTMINNSGDEVNLCNLLFNVKQKAENLYTHSINVALFAQILAKWLGLDEKEIELVQTTALLHDIGILKLPEKVQQSLVFRDELKTGKYDKHVILGYKVIKDKNIDFKVKQAVLTHHERIDGTGFPLQVPLANINKISRIVAIADTYDTLTMLEGGHKPLSPFQAIKYMEDTAYNKLDSKLLIVFLSKMAETFIQQKVRLSNGQMGKVVLINKYNLSRPLIQVNNGFIDLASRNDIQIEDLVLEF